MSHVDTLPESGTYDAGELIAQLTEQRGLYAELVGLTEHQRSLIAGGEPEDLLEVLGQRQKRIDRLGVLSSQLRRHQENWQKIRLRMSESDGREVDRLVSEVNGLLSTILACDKADVEQLAARRHATGASLAGLKRSREVGAAYAAEAETNRTRVNWTEV